MDQYPNGAGRNDDIDAMVANMRKQAMSAAGVSIDEETGALDITELVMRTEEEAAAAEGADEQEEPEGELSDLERVQKMFRDMHPQRRLFMKILRYCLEERADDELMAQVAGYIKHDYTVYSPALLCHIMAECGALSYEPPYDEEYENSAAAVRENSFQQDLGEGLSPLTMTVAVADDDGGKQGLWQTTPAAAEFLEADDPLGRFWDVLEKEPQLKPAYAELLQFCSRRGRTKLDIDERINKHPAMMEPRTFSGHLISNLEKCDCLEWDGHWRTTDLGKSLRENLAEE